VWLLGLLVFCLLVLLRLEISVVGCRSCLGFCNGGDTAIGACAKSFGVHSCFHTDGFLLHGSGVLSCFE
jgi:hypothetical protein